MSELNLPQTWADSELENLLDRRISYGVLKPGNYSEDGVPLLKIQNLREGYPKAENLFKISRELDKEYQRTRVKIGDVLVSVVGTIGKTIVVNKNLEGINISRALCLIRFSGNYDNEFFKYFMGSPLIKAWIDSEARGAAQKVINLGKLSKLSIPIPPNKEQERIVQKIETCFKKIDETEQNLNKVQVLLEKYRESLLAKAFRGELIPQNPDDEPASVLLSKIRAEREKLEATKKKKVQAFAPISDDEKPFDIPESWEWCYFEELADFINGDRGKNYPNREEYVPEGIPWINTGHIRPDGNLDLNKMHYISQKKFDSLNGGKIKKDDLVYCLRGATIGKTAFVKQFVKGAIASSLMIIRLEPLISNIYIYYFLISYYGKSQIKKFDNGSAQPNLSANSVGKYLIPIPPLEEQKKINEIIERSILNVTSVALEIEKITSFVELLRESVLSKAFEGRLVEQIESEGTGHELLEKILASKEVEQSEKETKNKTSKKKSTKKKTSKMKV